jgi:glycosyltransferase involved in cell wall biosynthesis
VAVRIAVVAVGTEAPGIASLLDKLSFVMDELVVVDNGSSERSRAVIESWLSDHANVRLLSFGDQRGPAAAHYLAFSDLRRRLEAAELSPQDLVVTLDLLGQYNLDVLDDLHRCMVEEQLDALLVRRDLSSAPLPARLGNALLSGWATLWARPRELRLHDVESTYRIFRLAAVADALDYYDGHRTSDAVDLAVTLSRLGYRVRNDVLVPVLLPRSVRRTAGRFTDVAAIPATALSVTFRSRGWIRRPY